MEDRERHRHYRHRRQRDDGGADARAEFKGPDRFTDVGRAKPGAERRAAPKTDAFAEQVQEPRTALADGGALDVRSELPPYVRADGERDLGTFRHLRADAGADSDVPALHQRTSVAGADGPPFEDADGLVDPESGALDVRSEPRADGDPELRADGDPAEHYLRAVLEPVADLRPVESAQLRADVRAERRSHVPADAGLCELRSHLYADGQLPPVLRADLRTNARAVLRRDVSAFVRSELRADEATLVSADDVDASPDVRADVRAELRAVVDADDLRAVPRAVRADVRADGDGLADDRAHGAAHGDADVGPDDGAVLRALVFADLLPHGDPGAHQSPDVEPDVLTDGRPDVRAHRRAHVRSVAGALVGHLAHAAAVEDADADFGLLRADDGGAHSRPEPAACPRTDLRTDAGPDGVRAANVLRAHAHADDRRAVVPSDELPDRAAPDAVVVDGRAHVRAIARPDLHPEPAPDGAADVLLRRFSMFPSFTHVARARVNNNLSRIGTCPDRSRRRAPLSPRPQPTAPRRRRAPRRATRRRPSRARHRRRRRRAVPLSRPCRRSPSSRRPTRRRPTHRRAVRRRRRTRRGRESTRTFYLQLEAKEERALSLSIQTMRTRSKRTDS